MMLPFYYLLQVIICSGVLFLYYHLALRNRLFHQWNRFYLIVAVVLSLTLPLLDWNVDKPDELPVAGLVTTISEVRSSIEVVAIEQESSFSLKDLVGPVYALVSAVLLFVLAFSLGKILKVIRTSESRKVGDVYIIDSNAPGTPFSFFRFIFWNNEIDIRSSTGSRIVEHEMVHVREWHSVDKIFMQLLLAVCWINPFFWLIRRELRSIHEFIADQRSAGDEGGAALAAMILKSSFGKNSSFITNQFFHTSIKRRVAMISKSNNPKVNYFTRVLALPVIAFIAFAFTVKSQSSSSLETIPPFIETATSVSSDPAVSRYDTVPHKSKATRVDFLKNGKALVYFDTGFEITTWEDAVERKYITAEEAESHKRSLRKNGDPLIVFNGEVKTEHTEKSSDIFKSGASKIIRLPAKEAVAKYGEAGRNGAIEIIAPVEETPAPVFVKVETEATIDKEEWREFLTANILPMGNELAESGKFGLHTITMKLLVEADGTVSNATAEDDLGLGIKEELEMILLRSPKWNPAVQNGRTVRSYVRKPITFSVVDGTSGDRSGPVHTQVDKPAKLNPQEWRRFMDAVMPEIVKDSKYKDLILTMSIDVRLLIGKDGRVEDAKVINDESIGVERALEKQLLASPRWEPAQLNGEPVRVYVNLPIHVILNSSKSAMSNYPETEAEELKKMTIHQLLGVPPSVEIISCTIAIDQPNGDIVEVKNTGNEFTAHSRRIISTAQKGLILTVDAILVKKQDGSTKKMPARVYKM